MTSLKKLYLFYNKISDEEDLKHLGTLTKLELLWIQNNPVCPGYPGTKKFASKVKAAIPHLKSLNAYKMNDMNNFK